MPLVTIRDLTIRFRGPTLLDGIDCLIEPGQRIGLLGRNGAGKTTFLKLLAQQLEPDHGTVEPQGRVALLPQEVPQDLDGTVAEIVRAGSRPPDNLHSAEEAEWQVDHRVDQILSRMDLPPDAPVGRMSSGMKRRVLLARALVDQPDLLLLDEPTNHLDIDSIRWLEDFLARWKNAFIFITHDRQFLRRLATRILEIDRGRLFDWTCDYATFLRRKQEALAATEKQEAQFDRKLAEEEAWIRQGIKARRTRNEGRVRALKELRRLRGERPAQVGTSKLQIQSGERSGNLVLHAEKVSFAHATSIQGSSEENVTTILEDFTTTIMRGDKVGVVGPNGAGKTTLLKLLLGQLPPDTGSVRLGANLQIAYFDQLRAQLDDEKTVEEEVGDGYQTIQFNGQSRHVLGYLQDFLFTPERARTPIRRLSGGERNRILLAKLFAKPANLIVLDEPTNDLDAETLELLEERLVEYQGTLIVVSHDREFLNNVVTSCLVFEPSGDALRSPSLTIREYVGGYEDWQRQASQATDAPSLSKSKTSSKSSPAHKSTAPAASLSSKAKKLTFKETQELEGLPPRIEQLEADIAELHQTMAEPSFYRQSGEEIAQQQSQLKQLEADLASAYTRWEDLEMRR